MCSVSSAIPPKLNPESWVASKEAHNFSSHIFTVSGRTLHYHQTTKLGRHVMKGWDEYPCLAGITRTGHLAHLEDLALSLFSNSLNMAGKTRVGSGETMQQNDAAVAVLPKFDNIYIVNECMELHEWLSSCRNKFGLSSTGSEDNRVAYFGHWGQIVKPLSISRSGCVSHFKHSKVSSALSG